VIVFALASQRTKKNGRSRFFIHETLFKIPVIEIDRAATIDFKLIYLR
jgi:hypothetical protein